MKKSEIIKLAMNEGYWIAERETVKIGNKIRCVSTGSYYMCCAIDRLLNAKIINKIECSSIKCTIRNKINHHGFLVDHLIEDVGMTLHNAISLKVRTKFWLDFIKELEAKGE